MKVTRGLLLSLTTYIWAMFVLLSWRHSNPLNLLNSIGFLSLIIIPGLLTILGIGLGRALPFWHRFGQIIGISILEIFIWLLFCNGVLPHLHLHRPLDREPLLIELSALYVGLVGWSYPRLRGFQFQLTAQHVFKSRIDVLASCIPLLFIFLSVIGAVSLNNGGTNIFTMLMLIGISVYMGILLLYRKKLHDNTFAWTLYMMGVSLLFMTSLRGWYVTGHDIQHEFAVFQLTQRNGRWSMANLRDPYNACLSITLLPTVFGNVLHVGNPYVYKVFFQLIFASVPVLIFMLMRRYLSTAKAFLAVIYFIGFPTFFTDMPFLNRQEIAFLFFILMLLVILDDRIKLLKRQWLFIAFGLGMVLSHYSTTYSVLSLLIFLMCTRPLFAWLAPKLSRFKIFNQSSVTVLNRSNLKFIPNITIPMIVMLLYFCFIWSTVITNTSTGATNIISQTVDSIKNGLNADSRSSDVSYSIFSPAAASPKQQLAEYVSQVVNPQRKSASSGTYYPAAVVKKDQVKIIPTYTAPLTKLGNLIQHAGLNVGSFNYALKQSSAKLLQILVAIGLLYILFKKRYNKKLEPEFFLLCGASLVFVLLQVVLPDVSQAYGLLRAFQQSLMVLGLLLVVGTFALSSMLRNKKLLYIIPTIIAIGFFASSTGIISQLLGGYQAQLFLNNSGQYYDVYYTHRQELASISWLNGITDEAKYGTATPALLQTDEFTASKLSAYTSIPFRQDVYPGIIQQDAYVLLGFTNVKKQQASIFYNGDLITYTYPTQLLNQQKNLIYSNGDSEIYR